MSGRPSITTQTAGVIIVANKPTSKQPAAKPAQKVTVVRDSGTGRFVPKEEAPRRPKTTEIEHYPKKK